MAERHGDAVKGSRHWLAVRRRWRARGTGGIVDFASGTFDSVKRAAEVTQEVSRVRPARFLNPDDRVVKTYNMAEAVGNKILQGEAITDQPSP